MTTWTLLIFLAYSGGADMGGVALDNQRIEFFSQDECKTALRDVRAALSDTFKRSVLVCVKRGAALLEVTK
jgi:hypothetical protein